tara:strand:+ start:20592 stop:21329 length:738 start_codon:yes stop_codon:yes gene_type:complete
VARTKKVIDFRDVQPHGTIFKVFDNVFMVTGTNITEHEGIRFQTSRNMIIIKNGDNLSLINTVRLDDKELEQLNTLGKVKNVVRIGAFHGYDDPFYVETYQADFWQMQGMDNQHEFKNIKILSSDNMPIPNSSLFTFQTTIFQEGIIILHDNDGILISCDSIQNWTKKDEFFSDDCWEMFVEQGLIGIANIPDTWVSACKPNVDELAEIKSLHFSHLLSAHGEPLMNSANQDLEKSLKNKFNIPI